MPRDQGGHSEENDQKTPGVGERKRGSGAVSVVRKRFSFPLEEEKQKREWGREWWGGGGSRKAWLMLSVVFKDGGEYTGGVAMGDDMNVLKTSAHLHVNVRNLVFRTDSLME